MRKVLNGGSVRRSDGEDKAVAVVSIAFSGLSPRRRRRPETMQS